MKHSLIISFVFLAIFGSATSFADNDVSFGAGKGSLYSGLGVNTALRGDNYIGYVAAGCLGVMSNPSGGWVVPCGLAVGWLQTDLLTKTNNRHGIGFFAGPVGLQNNKAKYGVGFTYEYFMQGVNNRGWNFGNTLATGRSYGDYLSLIFNAGYQF